MGLNYPDFNNIMMGKHWTLSEETKNKHRLNKLGNKNPMWKGDKVTIKAALHEWVRAYYPKKQCEYCGAKDNLDLANITGTYNRDFLNWRRLCRKCHMLSDGRINKNLNQYSSTYEQRSNYAYKQWITKRGYNLKRLQYKIHQNLLA